MRGASSPCKLPGEYNATDFDGPAPVGLAGAAFGFQDRLIAVQLNEDAAVDQQSRPL